MPNSTLFLWEKKLYSTCLHLTSLLASEVIPICKTYSRHLRKSAWSNRDHLSELKHKKRVRSERQGILPRSSTEAPLGHAGMELARAELGCY